MPILLVVAGYVFRFRSNDGREPPHVHVRGNDGSAKLWLAPTVRMASSSAYSSRQRSRIIRITEAHRDEWIAAWGRHFGDR